MFGHGDIDFIEIGKNAAVNGLAAEAFRFIGQEYIRWCGRKVLLMPAYAAGGFSAVYAATDTVGMALLQKLGKGIERSSLYGPIPNFLKGDKAKSLYYLAGKASIILGTASGAIYFAPAFGISLTVYQIATAIGITLFTDQTAAPVIEGLFS